MAYTSAADVAVNLGRTLSDSETAQVDQWIAWTEQIIEARLGDLASLDPDVLTRVTIEAVTMRARRPDPAVQVDVRVDDGQVSRRYERSSGQIEILPEWWYALGWREPSQAFTIRPTYVPDTRHARR